MKTKKQASVTFSLGISCWITSLDAQEILLKVFIDLQVKFLQETLCFYITTQDLLLNFEIN